jgi:ABC-2 type transport system ATP-binding protein
MKIEIQGLNKIYPNGNHALKDINLEFGTGMFGLLGPNGAGKSSLMRIMVTLMKPSSGMVLIDGRDIQKNRKKLRSMLGYLPQDFRFFTSLKTWEFLDYSGSLAGLKNRKDRIAGSEGPPGQQAFRRYEAAPWYCPGTYWKSKNYCR